MAIYIDTFSGEREDIELFSDESLAHLHEEYLHYGPGDDYDGRYGDDLAELEAEINWRLRLHYGITDDGEEVAA